MKLDIIILILVTSDEISTTSLPHFSYGPPTLDLPKLNQTIPSIQADFPDNSYLPPDITLQPPQFDPVPIEDTVVIPLPPTNQYLPAASSNQYETMVARMKVSNMSCLDDPVRGYFRATMTLTRVTAIPVVDDTTADCITGTGNMFRLNLEGDRMKKCAVRFCANGVNMCVTIRVPSIRGLKLGDDTLLTLRCRPQERIVSHTKHFKMNTKNLVHQARAIPTIATGGSQRNFETHVSLYRKSSTGRDFTVPVDPGSAVQLGEELLLRTTVRDGDGWRYSRMGEVLVHHVSSSGQVQQRAFTLVDSAGCRDIRMKAVCPDNPVQTSPLVSTLALRAFMVQGMASGDEMVMSVRMIGCLHYEDCHSKIHTCDDKLSKSSRSKRNANSTSNRTTDWQSYLEFRVVTPDVKDVAEGKSFNEASAAPKAIYLFTVLISGCLSTLATIAALIACKAVRKNKSVERY